MENLKVLTLGKYIKKKIGSESIYKFLKTKKCKIKHLNEYQKINFSEKFDLVISYGYGIILDDKTIKKISSNIINLHIGYLPFARGLYPLVWSLIFKKPLGITFHTIENKKIDSGKIIFKKKINLNKTYTLSDLHTLSLEQINKNFKLNFDKLFDKNKIKKIKILNSKYYFNKRISDILMYKFPKKWNTKCDYLIKNSKILKKYYKENIS
tara:strand:- start:272 stop:901 length:630 start_codon:yes stop_codon:yes gene_type:complete